MAVVLVILFFATVVRSTFGFGESLIAVPLLLLFIPVDVAVPLSVLVSIVVAGVITVQDRAHIHFRSAKWLILSAVPGIPVGLLVLIYANESWVKLTLGLLIIGYAAYSLVSKSEFRLRTDRRGWLFVCGFSSGVLGGAYGLNGPPLVIYGNLRKWTARHFRATLQAYFLPASTIGMMGYWYHGLLTSAVLRYFFFSLPVVLAAIFLGRFLNHRLKDGKFLRYVYVGLICVGVMLLAGAFR